MIRNSSTNIAGPIVEGLKTTLEHLNKRRHPTIDGHLPRAKPREELPANPVATRFWPGMRTAWKRCIGCFRSAQERVPARCIYVEARQHRRRRVSRPGSAMRSDMRLTLLPVASSAVSVRRPVLIHRHRFESDFELSLLHPRRDDTIRSRCCSNRCR